MFHCRDETPSDNVLIPRFTTLLEEWKCGMNTLPSHSLCCNLGRMKSRERPTDTFRQAGHTHTHTRTHTISAAGHVAVKDTNSAMQPYEFWPCRVRQIVRAENNSQGEQMKGYQSIFCCINLRIWACWGKKERKKEKSSQALALSLPA